MNELISNLRKSAIDSKPVPPTVTTPSLPPQIRSLLALPESAPPRPRTRIRQRFDTSGRRIPAGPAAPLSWLSASRHAPQGVVARQRILPSDVRHLPGLLVEERNGRRLQDMCVRAIARDWETMKEYESNNLAFLPVRFRMQLLSYIAVYGPEEGVGFQGLKTLLLPPNNGEVDAKDEFDTGEQNLNFFRLDLSGAMGGSVNFKQLNELLEKRSPPAEDELKDFSWEDSASLPTSLSAIIPNLKHLSLSHPSPSISWSRLLAFSKTVPTLTHLSLAFWPVPSMTPNAKTAVVKSGTGRDIQYGATNYYSHILDDDFREAAETLNRLSARLYSLVYLDLTGCQDWFRALRWTKHRSMSTGMEWQHHWLKLTTLKLGTGLILSEESEYCDIGNFVNGYKEASVVRDWIEMWNRRRTAKHTWIDTVLDDWEQYAGLWVGRGDEERRKRRLLEALKVKETGWKELVVDDADEEDMAEVELRSTSALQWSDQAEDIRGTRVVQTS